MLPFKPLPKSIRTYAWFANRVFALAKRPMVYSAVVTLCRDDVEILFYSIFPAHCQAIVNSNNPEEDSHMNRLRKILLVTAAMAAVIAFNGTGAMAMDGHRHDQGGGEGRG